MRSFFRTTALFLLFGTGSAFAQQSSDNGIPAGPARAALDGAGLYTCSQFIDAAAREDGSIRLYAGWVDGFLSGVNASRPDTFDITPWQSTELVLSMVRQFCSKNPELTYGDAVSGLFVALYEDRLVVEDEIVRVESGKQGVFVYRTVISSLHAALIQAGYDAPSGETFREQSRAALRKFQRDEGLAESGLPDQVTLFRLFVGKKK
ncbi:MAG: peptidoglycan-binding protein [Pseudomonadota bacterium]